VTQNNLPTNNSSATDWQNLGDLELSTSSIDIADSLEKWMVYTLEPINLPDFFISKIIKSGHRAVYQSIESNNSNNRFDHIHLRLFAPNNHDSLGLTWGFFRIEKLGNLPENGHPSAHVIEFYLYLESQ
jgi:hypothetical protein